MPCLDDNAVLDYVDGGATVPAAVQHHLATCPTCRALVAAMARGAAPAGGDAGDEPGRVGRFVIEDVIGRGGMGVVYRAWDPQLARRVALKRVRHAGEGRHGEEARARLVREARALAQLAHPNIVAIHDVAVHDGDVYIAMEYIAGANLREWLAAAPRTRAAIEDVLLAVARGLEVAHAAGLVHRDVKPDNVLVGDDGRVRVVDFGLVAVAGDPASAAASGSALAIGSGVSLTQTGAAVGTPAFMAPEQRGGAAADAPGDQWSFAVTACVALTGTRPAVPEGRDAGVELPAGLTPRVGRVLARALALDPAARFPSMQALTAALARAFAPRRWRAWAAAAVALALLAAVLVVAARGGRGPAGETCAPAAVGLRDVWTDDIAAAIARGFAASGHPRAGDARDRVTGALARQAASWVDLRRGLCRDDAGGRGPAPERAARGRCLERGRIRLRALTAALRRPLDRDGVDGAVVAAASLGSLLPCADGAALAAAERGAPVDPVAAAALDERLAQVEAELALGRYPAAIAAGEALARDAAVAGDPRRQARAIERVAAARTADGDLGGGATSAREAIKVAARAGDDPILADGWIALVSVLAELERHDEAAALVEVAEAAVARAGEDPRQGLRLLEARTTLAMWTKAYDAVVPAMDLALPAAIASLGAGDPDVIRASHTHAEALLDVNRVDDARRWADLALAEAIATFGDGHPRVYPAHKVIGLVLLAQREPARAREHLAALAAWADTRGPKHPDRYYGHTALSWCHADLGELDRAVAELELARRAAIDAGGPDDVRVSVTEATIGDYAWATGDLARAEAAWTRALAIRRQKHDPGHLTIGRAASGLGGLLAARGDRARARPLLEEAVAILEAAADSPDLALARSRLAHVLWQDGERARAHRLVALMRPQAEGEQGAIPPDIIALQRWVKERCPDVACRAPR